jgi:hypothetical protein
MQRCLSVEIDIIETEQSSEALRRVQVHGVQIAAQAWTREHRLDHQRQALTAGTGSRGD